MDHYEYVRQMCKPVDPKSIRTPAYQIVHGFYSQLFQTCKETLNGSYDYSLLKDPSSSFHRAVFTINGYTEKAIGEKLITALVCHEMYHVACFEQAGRKTYEVAPALAEALRDTELRGLTVSDLRFPYESVIIRVPPNVGFEVWGGPTGWHKTECMYLTHSDKELHVIIVGGSKNDNPGDNAVFYFDIKMDDDLPLEDLKDDMHSQIQHLENNEMLPRWKQQFDWAINVLLYITSSSAELEEMTMDKDARQLEKRLLKAKGTKREKILARLRTMNRRKVVCLGRSLKADMAKEAAGVRFRVRGHWHKYWTGSGRTELTAKWVQPYWKGEGMESNPVVRLTQ